MLDPHTSLGCSFGKAGAVFWVCAAFPMDRAPFPILDRPAFSVFVCVPGYLALWSLAPFLALPNSSVGISVLPFSSRWGSRLGPKLAGSGRSWWCSLLTGAGEQREVSALGFGGLQGRQNGLAGGEDWVGKGREG